MEIDLLTINTWKCDGDYYKRRKVLAEGVKEMGWFKDRVILCQECFRSGDGNVDTIEYLAGELNIPGYFVPARRKLRSLDGDMTDSFSGLGILTNLPVRRQVTVELPSSPADGGRVAQVVELATGVPMLVANVHLTHLRNSMDLRMRQLECVLQEISRSAARCQVVGGDFNAAENSTEIRSLMERGIDHASHWVDHLFILSPAAEPYPKFTRTETVLDRPDEASGLYPSDHFGVHAHLLVSDHHFSI